jgi:predicted porin
VKNYIVPGLALTLLTTPALADDSVTLNGITLYGTVDIGMAYQTHGAPLSDYFGPGLEYLLQKNSNRSVLSLAPNALSQSHIGVKGMEALSDGISALFKVEAQFNPNSGNISDHLKAMTLNNGVPLASQTTNADSSRAGQAFQNAYVGITSERWGTLTVGRQNSLVLDNVLVYDPMGGAQGFSLIGFSGTTAGGGNTEDARLDAAVKYKVKTGMIRFAALGQFNGAHANAPGAAQFGLGANWGGLSVDGLYSFVKDAVAASPLATVPAGYSASNALAGTVSDNTALSLMTKYSTGPATGYAGYEHLVYANPSTPLAAGTSDIGGYVLATVTNTAFTHHKSLEVMWAGLKYAVTPEFSITGAFYRYYQFSYSGNGCSNISSGKCSGVLESESILADYAFNKHLDVYGGAMYTHVYNGLANGYLFNNTIDPMIGVRIRF